VVESSEGTGVQTEQADDELQMVREDCVCNTVLPWTSPPAPTGSPHHQLCDHRSVGAEERVQIIIQQRTRLLAQHLMG
jgi:hypothetical protein